MVEYQMMHEGCVLTYCLHRGTIPLAEALDAEAYPVPLEEETKLSAGTIARYLKSLCRAYGSCGVMAVPPVSFPAPGARRRGRSGETGSDLESFSAF